MKKSTITKCKKLPPQKITTIDQDKKITLAYIDKASLIQRNPYCVVFEREY
jgi:hypothetical protein